MRDNKKRTWNKIKSVMTKGFKNGHRNPFQTFWIASDAGPQSPDLVQTTAPYATRVIVHSQLLLLLYPVAKDSHRDLQPRSYTHIRNTMFVIQRLVSVPS